MSVALQNGLAHADAPFHTRPSAGDVEADLVAVRAGGAGWGIPTRRAGAFSVILFRARVSDPLAPTAGPPSRGFCAMGWPRVGRPGDRTRAPLLPLSSRFS